MDSRERTSGKALRSVLIAGGVLCALMVVATGGYYAFAKMRIAHTQREMRAAGWPTSFEDLQAAYDTSGPEGIKVAETYNKAFALMKSLEASIAPETPVVGTKGERLDPGTPLSPSGLQNSIAVLDAHAEALRLVHEAATGQPARFSMDIAKQAVETGMSHLASLRAAQRLLMIEAIVAAQQNRADDATKALLAQVGLIHALDNEPLLISQLVRVACAGLFINTLNLCLNSTSFTPAQFEALQAGILNLRSREAFKHGLTGEFAFSLSLMQEGNGPLLYSPNFENEKACVDALDAAIPVDAVENIPDDNPVLAGIGRSLGSYVKDAALEHCAASALAVLRYRSEKGALPGSLQELVPAYLSDVPTDPYDGQSLRYRATDGGGFVVYSVGADKIDANGVTDSWRANQGKPDEVVFSILR